MRRDPIAGVRPSTAPAYVMLSVSWDFLSFLVARCSCCCTYARRRDRGVQASGGFAGTRNAGKLPSPPLFGGRRFSCVMGGSCLTRAEGLAPKQRPAAAGQTCVRRQAGIAREGSSPNGRDRARFYAGTGRPLISAWPRRSAGGRDTGGGKRSHPAIVFVMIRFMSWTTAGEAGFTRILLQEEEDVAYRFRLDRRVGHHISGAG